MGRDEERLAAEERGEERPERPRSLSATYLEQSLDALHAAGNPAVLFERWRDQPPKNKTAEAFMLLTARRTHLARCRTATLFAALAAESYVNEFLAAHLQGKDLRAVDRLSPVDKYVLGTKLAYGEALFFRDREPVPVIDELFRLRNRLVHPKPGFGPAGPLGPSGDFERLFPPTKVAEFVISVAGAGVVMVRRSYGFKSVDFAHFIWFGRWPIAAYGKRATRLPSRDGKPEVPLLTQAMDALKERRSAQPPDGPGERPPSSSEK